MGIHLKNEKCSLNSISPRLAAYSYLFFIFTIVFFSQLNVLPLFFFFFFRYFALSFLNALLSFFFSSNWRVSMLVTRQIHESWVSGAMWSYLAATTEMAQLSGQCTSTGDLLSSLCISLTYSWYRSDDQNYDQAQFSQRSFKG